METKNWVETGLLHGLDGKTSVVVEKYLNEIDSDFMKHKPHLEKEFGTVFPAVVRHIIRTIFQREEIEGVIKGISTNELLDAVDIKEVSDMYLIYIENFIPYGRKYLPHIDSDAHLTLMFCDNYVFRMIDRVKYKS